MVANKGAKKTQAVPVKNSFNTNNNEVGTSGQKRANSSNVLANESAKRPRLDLCDVENLPNGNVLTLGQGDMGQLGLGDEILSRKKPAVVKELSDIKIKKIVAGALHSVCLTDDNKLYSFGCNDEFALGRETDEDTDPEHLPRLVVGPLSSHKVARLTAGDSHTMTLTSEGKVFLWGVFRDSHGKLGLFSEEEVCRVPTIIPSLNEAIVSIASGNDHVVMVSISGKVYTMGCCEQGQLGRVARYFTDRKGQRHANAASEGSFADDNVTEILLRPQKVIFPKLSRGLKQQKPVEAFAGAYTSWVLTDDDAVYACGLNNWNQLGFSDNENRYRPELCPSLTGLKVKQIVGGQHHSVVLVSNGRVFCMGRGEYGRLGLGPHIKQADKLVRIDSLEEIISVSACSAVSFAVDSKGGAHGWGFGSNLQLTTGEEDDEWVPVLLTGRNLEDRKVLEVAAGGQHTVVLAGLKEEDST